METYKRCWKWPPCALCLKYVDLYLTSEWGRFYVGHPVVLSAGFNVSEFIENRNGSDSVVSESLRKS
jgi:hypothetical protein